MSEINVSGDEKSSLVIDKSDNVAVALQDLLKGDKCKVNISGEVHVIKVIDKIPFGHKFAITPIAKNESVLKYGEEIGKMKVQIEIGGWIHNHNMYCERGMK